MTVIAKAQITVSRIIDISSVTRYYLLQSSTANPPAKPTKNPPGGSWVTVEPSYTNGSTNTLYFVDLTVFTNSTFSYSAVSKSSSYEAAKAAYNKAVNAQQAADDASKVATNYLKLQGGIIVGDHTAKELGENVLIDTDSVDVRNGTETLATFGEKTQIGKTEERHLKLNKDFFSMMEGTKEYFSFRINEKFKELVDAGQYFEGCHEYYEGDVEGTYTFQLYPHLLSKSIVKGKEYIWHVCSGAGEWLGGSSAAAPKLDYGYVLFTAQSNSVANRDHPVVYEPAMPNFVYMTDASYNTYTCYCSRIDLSDTPEFKLKGRMIIDTNNDVNGKASSSAAPLFLGNPQGQHLAMDSNEIMSKSNDTTPSTLDFNAEGGAVIFNRNDVKSLRYSNGVLSGKNGEWDTVNWYSLLSGPNDSGNIVIGYGGYANERGQTNLYGNKLMFLVKTNGQGVSYKPYYEAGDSFKTNWSGAGFVSNSGQAVFFTVPLAKPVLGNPKVTIENVAGFIFRQNNKYTHGSTASNRVMASTYSATLEGDGQMIVVRANFEVNTNVINNSPIGIAAGIEIRFS